MESDDKMQATQKILKIEQPQLEARFPAFAEFDNEQHYFC